MRPPVLIDASSAILLEKAGLIHRCCQAFSLLMPRAVFDEVTAPNYAGSCRLGVLVGRRPGVGLLDDPVTHQAAREAVSAALVATGKQVCQVERQGPTRGRSVGTVSLRRPAVKICHACNNTHVCI